MTVKTPIAPRQTKPELEHDYVRSPALGYESPETAGFIRCLSHGFPTPLAPAGAFTPRGATPPRPPPPPVGTVRAGGWCLVVFVPAGPPPARGGPHPPGGARAPRPPPPLGETGPRRQRRG